MAGIVRGDTAARRAAQFGRQGHGAGTAERAKKARLAALRAAESFWKSPPGQAVKAFQRGDEFFELQLPHSAVRYDPLASATGPAAAGLTRADVLGQIEEVGWRLLQASWVYVTAQDVAQDAGEVVGIYLFRRDETNRRAGGPWQPVAAD